MGPRIIYAAKDVSYTSPNQIGGTSFQVDGGHTRVHVCLVVSAAVKLSAKVDGQATAGVFNNDANLTVNAWHRFDLELEPGRTVEFTLSGNCTIHYVSIQSLPYAA